MALEEGGHEKVGRGNAGTCMHVGYGSWTKPDMDCLINMLVTVTCFSSDIRRIAEHLQRSPEAIGRRLSKMGWSSQFHKHRRGSPAAKAA